MASVSGVEYALVFLSTLVFTLVLTPLALGIAVRGGALDHPGAIKAQRTAVPYLGGAAILLAFVAVVLGAALVRPPTSGIADLALVLGTATMLALVGLLDDLRGLSPWVRLGVEGAAGVVVWSMPGSPSLFGQDTLNLVLTVAWIVLVTNAFNLLDNMDGLSAGVASIAAFFMFVIAAGNEQFLVATLSIALAGCTIGFLRSNFHPARIYMGDAGALFIGFLLGVLTLRLDLTAAPRLVALGVPVVLLGIPLFDTTLVTVNRLAHGRSPLSGGRDHTSHRLVFIGIPVPVTVTLIYVAGASLGCLAIVLAHVDQNTGLVLLGWLMSLALLLGSLLSLVPVYENSRRRRLMLRVIAPHEEGAAPPGEEGAA